MSDPLLGAAAAATATASHEQKQRALCTKWIRKHSLLA
jgi:hypothetical protein